MSDENLNNRIFTFNVSEVNFHPALKDIENIFWFFILAHKALARLDVQNIIKTTEDPSIVSMLEKYNRWINLQIKINKNNTYTSNSNILNSMILIEKAMVILLYEFLKGSNYGKKITEDEGFKFLKHIRNGASHNNKFNFKYQFGKNKGMWMIEENEIIKWNGMEINRKLHETIIFNDFISLPNIFLLTKYFSDRLMEIDNTQK